jgi:hypothetical protein
MEDSHNIGSARDIGVRKPAEVAALSAELEALARMDAAALRVAWRRLFRVHPPKQLSRDMLELGVAWKLQERVLGGIGATAKRQILEMVQRLASKSDLAKARKTSLKPGARLMRAWGGETHEVEVIEGGFVWRGRAWNSLSAIAREITGAHWSGPRFFGLDQPKTSSGAARDPVPASHV